MTTPPGLPLEIILPSGRPAWLNPYQGTYSESRNYALRMQRNYSRGISQASARGHSTTAGGLSETQVRRQREQAKYQDELSPWQRFGIGFENRYGFTYNYWRKLRRRYIDEINARALPNAPSNRMIMLAGQRRDPRVFPADIAAIRQLYQSGFRDPVHSGAATWEQWTELRLLERLTAIRDYQDGADPTFGRNAYYARSDVWLSVNLLGGASGPPIELWWYH
jgi:hypothetical protein